MVLCNLSTIAFACGFLNLVGFAVTVIPNVLIVSWNSCPMNLPPLSCIIWAGHGWYCASQVFVNSCVMLLLVFLSLDLNYFQYIRDTVHYCQSLKFELLSIKKIDSVFLEHITQYRFYCLSNDQYSDRWPKSVGRSGKLESKKSSSLFKRPGCLPFKYSRDEKLS